MKIIAKISMISALLALVFYMPAHADINDLKKQIENKNGEIKKLEEEIKEFQENIEEAESTAKTLSAEIKRLDLQIKQLNSRISLTQKKISKKELEIKELGIDITDTKESIEDRQNELGNVLGTLNRIESENMLERFLKYHSISDFFGDLEKIKNLNRSIRETYNRLKVLKTDLEVRKQKAEEANKELKRLQRDLLVQREIQADNKTEKSNLLKLTKNQETIYQKLLKDSEKKRIEIYEEIRAIENELKKQIDVGTLPPFGKGITAFPVSGGVITQYFGKTNFAKNTDVYGNGTHNGVDFRAPVGTPVTAAESGIVKAIGNTDLICPRGSYGKWVLIEHQNKLATLYAHLSLVRVNAQETVGRSDLIGYSGNTGDTTGPHLHFTVYDARTVQLRPSRVCGILPYGGYLDPLNYL